MTKHLITKHLIMALLFAFMLIAVAGCDPQARGFALPDGDAEQGKINFIALACNECHSVRGSIEKMAEGGHPEIHYQLGGPVTRVRSYGDLVTSIINPTHKVSGYAKSKVNVDGAGNSRMRNYNQIMTVQQLVDLTTYLETTYEVVKPSVAPMYGP